MDIDPVLALKRRFDNSQPDRLEAEGTAFQKKVYEGYIKLAGLYPDRIKIISGIHGIDAAFSQIKSYVDVCFADNTSRRNNKTSRRGIRLVTAVMCPLNLAGSVC